MRKYIKLISPLPLIILITLLSGCSDNDVNPVDCVVTSVVRFDRAFTRFEFTEDGSGKYQLTSVKVYEGTDSAYTYTYVYVDGKLNEVTKIDGGETTKITASYSGDNLSKQTERNSTNQVISESRFEYSGSTATQVKSYLANQSGSLFQVGHSAVVYDSKGNITQSSIYLDIVAIFSLAFGQDPPGYAPQFFGSVEYESSDSPNPLYGFYFADGFDITGSASLPTKITFKDINGSVVQSDTYTIEKDDKGNPIKATSGSKYIEAEFECK